MDARGRILAHLFTSSKYSNKPEAALGRAAPFGCIEKNPNNYENLTGGAESTGSLQEIRSELETIVLSSDAYQSAAQRSGKEKPFKKFCSGCCGQSSSACIESCPSSSRHAIRVIHLQINRENLLTSQYKIQCLRDRCASDLLFSDHSCSEAGQCSIDSITLPPLFVYILPTVWHGWIRSRVPDAHRRE